MNDQITQKILSMLDTLQNGVGSTLNLSTKLAIQLAHYDAIANLLGGFVLLTVSIILLIVGWRDINRKSESESLEFWVFAWIGFFVCFVCSIYLLGNIYNWIGISNPQLYLAHQIMGKFLN